MLFGIDRNFRIVVDDIELKGEFPLPKDDRNIELELAKRLNYSPKGSISTETYQFEHICTLLNYVIKERPKQLEDFAEIYDYDWTMRVFDEYIKARKQFDESLKKNNRAGNDRDVREEPGNNPQPIFDEKLPPKTRKIS